MWAQKSTEKSWRRQKFSPPAILTFWNSQSSSTVQIRLAQSRDIVSHGSLHDKNFTIGFVKLELARARRQPWREARLVSSAAMVFSVRLQFPAGRHESREADAAICSAVPTKAEAWNLTLLAQAHSLSCHSIFLVALHCHQDLYLPSLIWKDSPPPKFTFVVTCSCDTKFVSFNKGTLSAA